MSSYPNLEVLNLIKELVFKLTNFEEGTNLFNHVENHIINRIHNADSMVFLKKKDIDRTIASLSEKFSFHGFSIQANDLQRHCDNFIPNSTPKNQLESKLNIVKFLLCLSESPTSKFLEDPERIPMIHYEEEIDWPAYLKEGIERWSPPPAESSDNWSDTSESDISINASPEIKSEVQVIMQSNIDNERYNVDGETLKDFLKNSIQSNWYLKDHVYMIPESSNVDANIAINWDDFLEYSVQGLLNIKRSNIITEYCVLREIIWQCYVVYNSFVFHFVGNRLLPKEIVTIASVRPTAFQILIHEFLPYIELLQEFRTFNESLSDTTGYVSAPDTYRSYNSGVLNFLKPLFTNLVEIEKQILAQTTTMTLLKVLNEFKFVFENATILKGIHESVILDFNSNDSIVCATSLLSRLHLGLVHSGSKTELDIYLTLYLESLFKYFTITNTWIGSDTLIDLHKEFIVKQIDTVPDVTMDVNDFSCTSVFTDSIVNYDHSNWQMGFVVHELSEICRDDSIFKLIYTDVLQISKNIHFLRLLKKLYLLGDSLNTESLYDELINRVLKGISSYFKRGIETDQIEISPSNEEDLPYKFPAICPDDCKYPTEMDRLENLVDTSDGFLMIAFKSYFIEENKKEWTEEQSLYEKISSITETLYPANQIVDRAFSQMLRDRYSKSGYLVKDILIEDFQMQKHFELLRHLFLFKDDIIFPLYKRLFTQMVDHKRFDNDIWLTTQLHDIMIDLYPDFNKKCTVKVSDATQIINDPLRGCEMIDITYAISWPVNFIIGEKHLEMYSELFRLILKVKWALYTLNHLYFNEIEPENTKLHQPKVVVLFLRKLKVFRFHLLNEFSNIQHYILGHVFSKYLRKFEMEFEQAYNLDTLIESHSHFINSVYRTAMDFKELNDKSHGFNLLLYIVKKFHGMWKDVKNVNEKELIKYEEMFMKCRNALDPIIFPRDVMMDS